MNLKFYLDDFNLITINQNIENTFSLFINHNKVHYKLENNSIIFDYDYKPSDLILIKYLDKIFYVDIRFITHTKRFNLEYNPYFDNLGSFIENNKTIFRFFAPFCQQVYLYVDKKKYLMNKKQKGIFDIEIDLNLDLKPYYFELYLNNHKHKCLDPLSFSNDSLNHNSYVIDRNKLNFKPITTKQVLSPIIYEASIRDFTSDINVNNNKTFKSFIKDNLKLNDQEIGVDYLKSLNITHLQLMPILNFDLDKSNYNWGYNPLNFNTFYNLYASDNNPYSTIFQFRELIDYLHLNNIKVVLDVVYNHVYNILKFDFQKICPYLFFRYSINGKPLNGSWCGNEICSENLIVRNYFNYINLRLLKYYDIDGLRFDLMGLIDNETINLFSKSLKSIKPDFILYGEGWDMSKIEYNKKTIISNAHLTKNVGYFNDYYRNFFRGNHDKGFLHGLNLDKEILLDCFNGSKNYNLNKDKSINYIECHDNLTFYDKTKLYFNDEWIIHDICKFGLAVVLFSKGISFIHSGQEFYRTKNGIDNTYNLDDTINKLDWNLCYLNKDSHNYLKNLIKIKNQFLNTIYDEDYTIEQVNNIFKLSNSKLDIYLNPNNYKYNYLSDIVYNKVFDVDNKFKYNIDNLLINRFSALICIK